MRASEAHIQQQGFSILFKESTTIVAGAGSPSPPRQQPRNRCRMPWRKQIFPRNNASAPCSGRAGERPGGFAPCSGRAGKRPDASVSCFERAGERPDTSAPCSGRTGEKIFSFPPRIQQCNPKHLYLSPWHKRQSPKNNRYQLGNGIALPRSGTRPCGIKSRPLIALMQRLAAPQGATQIAA